MLKAALWIGRVLLNRMFAVHHRQLLIPLLNRLALTFAYFTHITLASPYLQQMYKVPTLITKSISIYHIYIIYHIAEQTKEPGRTYGSPKTARRCSR